MARATSKAQLAALRAWLLDTGPLVAYLDASEKEHPEVSARLDSFTGQLFTTNAVVTEAMHFVAAVRKGPTLLAEFVAQSGIEVFDYGQADDQRRSTAIRPSLTTSTGFFSTETSSSGLPFTATRSAR